MPKLKPLTLETAPEGSKAPLEALRAAVGFIPNLAATMAHSPQLLRGFLAAREIYASGTFTAAEIEVLSLTSAVENDCAWCVAFHTFAALRNGVGQPSVDALRAGRAPEEPKLAALSDFAREMIRGRGHVSAAAHERFLAAGYRPAQALEVVLGMGFAMMANYAGHLADAPLDPPFVPHAWKKSA